MCHLVREMPLHLQELAFNVLADVINRTLLLLDCQTRAVQRHAHLRVVVRQLRAFGLLMTVLQLLVPQPI